MDLTQWDAIIISTSGGKDSQAMTDHVVKMAEAQGVKDRILLVHANLQRVEWKGVLGLVEEHAAHYGVPLRVVARPQGDFLDLVEKRGRWPDSQNRYCTSYLKRDQIMKVYVSVGNELLAKLGRRPRILSCIGLRAAESPARKKAVPFQVSTKDTNARREVFTWLPIHEWTLAQVWQTIRASGVRHHWAYDKGMPRLSCVFCIFAPKSALVLAGRHNPELLDRMVKLEAKMGHTFRQKLSLAEVQREVLAGGAAEPVNDWVM